MTRLTNAYEPPPLPPIDPVGLGARAADLERRQLAGPSRLAALDLVVRLLDLTSLAGDDTEDRVRRLCARALRPDADSPPVAAVCVHPALVPVAREELAGSPVRVASVAGAFPSGQSYPAVRLAEIEQAVAAGADEVDTVLDRAAFLAGKHAAVYEALAAARRAAGPARLKVILEIGELGGADAVRRAAQIALDAGADFLKTSTGQGRGGATLPATLVLLRAIRDDFLATGRGAGIKPAGGLRTSRQVLAYLVAVHQTLGGEWLTPTRLRFGASSLLDDVLAERHRLAARSARHPTP